MELSEEMKKNGWVTEIDEDGQSYTYNKNFFNKIFGQPETGSPKQSDKFIMLDITKTKDNDGK